MNYRNIESAELEFSPKLNCLIGMNGMGKTNVIDAIYLLSFCKSSLTSRDQENVRHGAGMMMVRGDYDDDIEVSCGLEVGRKKHFRLGKKEYKRLLDHIGLLPLVMVSPRDGSLVEEGSEERRRFMDGVISQENKLYLERLSHYGGLLKQRNALLKQIDERGGDIGSTDEALFDVLEMQMADLSEYIYAVRKQFLSRFIPLFDEMYNEIGVSDEKVKLEYVSQLNDRNILDSYKRTRQRDVILGWTSQGIHKDDLRMFLGDYGLKQVGSEGQRKSYLVALKLAEALYLSDDKRKPILLLDDIFDKLDRERVGRIVSLVGSERFGQIFISDTDRQHVRELMTNGKVFTVEYGKVNEYE